MKKIIRKIIEILFTDQYYIVRTNFNSTMSMLANFLWALSKIIAGLTTRVYLICVSGFFTLGLGLCKIVYFYGRKKDRNPSKDLFKMASILLASSLCYGTYMIFLYLFPAEPTKYGFTASLVITLIAIFKIIFSITGIRKMKRQKEPLVMGLKGVNLAGTMGNLVLIVSWLFFIFKKESNLQIISYINASIGIFSAIISILISLWMFRLANKTRLMIKIYIH